MSVSLTSESVQSTSLPLEGIDDIHSGYSLPLGVFSVGDSVSDDILEEYLEDTTGFLVDKSGDSFDSSSTSKSTDGWLGDSLDIISKDLTVTFGATLSKTLSSFAATRHVDSMTDRDCMAATSPEPHIWFQYVPPGRSRPKGHAIWATEKCRFIRSKRANRLQVNPQNANPVPAAGIRCHGYAPLRMRRYTD